MIQPTSGLGCYSGGLPNHGDFTGPWPSNPFRVGLQIGRCNTSDCVRYYPLLFTGRWVSLDTAITHQLTLEQISSTTPAVFRAQVVLDHVDAILD